MSKEQPHILVCNDDGILAPGIAALVEVARKMGKVTIVAPDSPQSGMGHAITVGKPLRLYRVRTLFQDLVAYQTNGTPVDCVKMATQLVLDKKPDLLVSGINHGSNSSINVLYSGTMSAAVEGALEGIPSIGFSLNNYSHDADFGGARHYARIMIREALQEGIMPGVALNVNIPDLPEDKIKGIRVVRQAEAMWEDMYDKRKDPAGRNYYWVSGTFSNRDKGEDTDEYSLRHHYVSVVPVQFDMTAHHAISQINQWNFGT